MKFYTREVVEDVWYEYKFKNSILNLLDYGDYTECYFDNNILYRLSLNKKLSLYYVSFII